MIARTGLRACQLRFIKMIQNVNSKTCFKGETPNPSSPYNLAGGASEAVWKSDHYDLRSYENGLCHTYNPPHPSGADFLNRMFFMINKGNFPSINLNIG